MTLVALPTPLLVTPAIPGCWFPSGSLGSDVTTSLSAAGRRLAFVFTALSSTPPDGLAFRVFSVTTAGTAGAMNVSIQPLDSTGVPTGTPVTDSNTIGVTTSAVGVYAATGLAGTASLTTGTDYALVIEAGTGWDRNLALMIGNGNTGGARFPYYLTYNGSAWTKAGNTSTGYCAALLNASGNYLQTPGFAGPFTAFTVRNVNDSSNPDEYGIVWTPSFPCRLSGILCQIGNGNLTSSSDCYGGVYSDPLGTPTLLTSQLMPGQDALTLFGRHLHLTSPVDLTAGQAYGLTLKAASSVSMGLAYFGWNSNSHLASFMGTQTYQISRNGGTGAPASGSAFTADNTKFPLILPILSHISDGAGSGGGLMTHPGMAGGIHA